MALVRFTDSIVIFMFYLGIGLQCILLVVEDPAAAWVPIDGNCSHGWYICFHAPILHPMHSATKQSMALVRLAASRQLCILQANLCYQM